MSPIIPINGAIIFWPVTIEFSADGRMVSVYPSCNLTQTKIGTLEMTDEISLIFCKMCIGHDRFLLGIRSVVLLILPDLLSCLTVILSGAL